MKIKDKMNKVNGKFRPSTNDTFTNKEKLKAPIKTAFTDTNFIPTMFFNG